MSARKSKSAAAIGALAAAAAAKPGAWVDHPWGHDVYKVGKKMFVILGDEDGLISMTVKLPDSGEAALTMFSFTEPTGYGLGKSGWVSASFAAGEAVPVPLLVEWIDESYAAVAPKPPRAARAAVGKSAASRSVVGKPAIPAADRRGKAKR